MNMQNKKDLLAELDKKVRKKQKVNLFYYETDLKILLH